MQRVSIHRYASKVLDTGQGDLTSRGSFRKIRKDAHHNQGSITGSDYRWRYLLQITKSTLPVKSSTQAAQVSGTPLFEYDTSYKTCENRQKSASNKNKAQHQVKQGASVPDIRNSLSKMLSNAFGGAETGGAGESFHLLSVINSQQKNKKAVETSIIKQVKYSD